MPYGLALEEVWNVLLVKAALENFYQLALLHIGEENKVIEVAPWKKSTCHVGTYLGVQEKQVLKNFLVMLLDILVYYLPRLI